MYIFLGCVFILYSLVLLNHFSTDCNEFSVNNTKFLKAILSILIMLAHANMFIDSPTLMQLKSMGAARVSFFFFISGYGLIYSFSKKGIDYLSGFMNKRVWHIVKPFLLINIIFILYLTFVNGGIPKNIISNISRGTLPVYTSWYIVILTIQYILFYFIFKIENIALITKINILTLITIFEIILLYLISYDRCWWVSTISFPVGMYYRYYIDGINRIMSLKRYKLIYMPLGCVIVGILLLLKIEVLYSFAYIIIPLLIIIPICFFKDRENNKVILFINSISYEIYLVHIVIFSILATSPLFMSSNVLFMTASIILTIICSYLFKLLCNISFVKKK